MDYTNQNQSDFNSLTQNIETSIQKISQNVLAIQRMVNQIGTPQDSSDVRNQLDQVRRYTQSLIKDTSENLRKLSHITMTGSRVEKVQKDRLAEEFSAVLTRFKANCKQQEMKIREEIRHNRQNVRLAPPPDSKQNKHMIELKDSRQQQTQIQIEDEANIQGLEEQLQVVKRLEDDIEDVNKIFKDLGRIIHDQGETIDSIEAHVENTWDSVRQGTDQLNEARILHTKILKRKACLYGGLSVCLFLLLWYIYHSFTN